FANKGQTPWTPAVSVLFGLQVGLDRLIAEGPERTWARHEAIARGAQAGMEAAGLRLVAPPGHRSPTVTAAWLPDGLEWAPFNDRMRAQGLVIAGGQGKWTSKILRFGHMGHVEWPDIAAALRVLAETLTEFGQPADAGTTEAAGRDAFESALVARGGGACSSFATA